MKHSIYLIALCLGLTFGCRPSEPVKTPQAVPTTQYATSEKGMVSTAHPLATQAGMQMLADGGNAVDAAVSAAFVLSVVEPSMSGLGGRLQAILRTAEGAVHGVDATTQAPEDYDAETAPKGRYGYPSIGIPGVVAGLTKLLEEHGTKSLSEVMAPAIQYAEEGFALLKGEAFRHSLAYDMMKEFPGTVQHFLKPDSSLYQEGDVWVQKELAETLKKIAEGGKKAFYEGEIAQKIVADNQANGGVLSLEALAAYEAKSSKIVTGSYRGHDLHALWMPSFGAITIEIMHILEQFPMDSLRGADWAEIVAEAIAAAYQDRRSQTSDSMATVLTSKEYAAEQAKKISLAPLGAADHAAEMPEAWLASWGHTTHLTVADESGMMIALTQSNGPNMGSKVATPSLGFLYATTLGGYLGDFEPGQRASSHISPFLLTKDGQPFMALGAAGGSRIVTAIAAVNSRVIDHEMSLDLALAAPRVYPVEDSILMETHEGAGWKDEVIQAIEQKGIPYRSMPQIARFGRIHAVMYDAENKVWVGAADPDWEGVASGPK
ncbi:MAG: gamma-glutamyltransferase [Bacteroidota bacterium]